MLAGALPLRLVEKDVLPANRAKLEWRIEHRPPGSTQSDRGGIPPLPREHPGTARDETSLIPIARAGDGTRANQNMSRARNSPVPTAVAVATSPGIMNE